MSFSSASKELNVNSVYNKIFTDMRQRFSCRMHFQNQRVPGEAVPWIQLTFLGTCFVSDCNNYTCAAVIGPHGLMPWRLCAVVGKLPGTRALQ
jgi:hypothetical protein